MDLGEDPEAPPTEAECRRTVNMGRLASVLNDMADHGFETAVGEEAIGWRFRDDFEQQLDAWEAGRHPHQIKRAG